VAKRIQHQHCAIEDAASHFIAMKLNRQRYLAVRAIGRIAMPATATSLIRSGFISRLFLKNSVRFCQPLAGLCLTLLMAWALPGAATGQVADWIEPMKQVHARFTGNPGTLALFGDSITVSLAFWTPLEGEPKAMSSDMTRAHRLVKAYMKPECWRQWRGPAFGNEGRMTIRWAHANVDRWLKKLNPEAAVIMFGSNDVGEMEVAEYEQKTREVVRCCLMNGTVVLLTTLPPRSGRLDKSKQFAEAVRKVARDERVPLIDYFAAILERRPDDWDGASPQFKQTGGDEYQVPTLIAGDGVQPSNPRQFNDFSDASLRQNGFALRNYLTVLGYAAVIENVFQATSSRPSSLHTWQRWEHTLTSTRPYDNPYANIILRVTYRGPDRHILRTYGFWDGGNVFRIRCAFPAPGSWQWETECSDTDNPGLHRQRGRVDVSPYRGANPLYRHGFLKVSDNRRYLTLSDGTPFLWMGDTAWSVPQRANDEEWETYLVDRAAKHFTVIQVGPASAWAGPTDRQGQKPFTDKACSQWNPAYWQAFERKIQRANEAGLVVLLVGLMEPVHRYPEADQACRFAQNIVARLFGNFVIFSPSFDSNFMPLANQVGQATREATAVHLITQHPGTPWNTPTPTFSDKYYDEPYLDIAAVQTGHNGGHLDWCAHHAIEWALHLYRHEPHKPAINLEAMYDAQGTNGWRAVDTRSLGWRSWLSGAMGYSYGAGDVPPKVPRGSGAIWKWVTDPEKYDYWKKALQWDSAFQMQHLHDFLATLEWWRLEPAHELIRNQPGDVTRRRVLAKTAGGDLAVAYLPDEEAIEVDLSSFPAPLTGRWFDPVHGQYTPLPNRIANQGIQRFTTPAQGDWVLLLQDLRRAQK
jgi:hypothetical protein